MYQTTCPPGYCQSRVLGHIIYAYTLPVRTYRYLCRTYAHINDAHIP